MIYEINSFNDSQDVQADADVNRWKEAGAALGCATCGIQPRGSRRRSANRQGRIRALVAKAAANPQGENADCVLDNFRLIFGADKEAREFCNRARRYPAIVDSRGAEIARVSVLARAYLEEAAHRFSEAELAAFVEGYEQTATLNMEEIWALKPALLLELVDRLTDAETALWPVLVGSLKKVNDTAWKEFFESVSYTHRILTADPAGAYQRMDFESRQQYREAVADLAKCSPLSEREVAEAAIDFCEDAFESSDGSRAAVRRTHIGYYLLDRGRSRLESIIDYRPPLVQRLHRLIRQHPTTFYLAGIELVTLGIIFGVLNKLDNLAAVYAGLLLLALPASQAAVDFMGNLVGFLLPPKALPKLDFSEGIPEECSAMVVVPTLLLNEAQVHDLVLDLEIRFLANRDRNLHFALLTDSPDSDRAEDPNDELIELCKRLIIGLNERYQGEGRSPFFLFHRYREYNESEGRWMAWERKRGKLLQFNQLLRNHADAFPVKVGDLSVLPRVQYVITLDSDTQLPRDSAARLVGALAHPLNRAVIDPRTRMVVEGYGILQPRMGISIESATRSRLAALYSGQTGLDLYTRAVFDVYQDLFGEGIFAGKGIYEVDTLDDVLEWRFPENTLLSHDLIEGVYARAGLVSDIQLIDDYPSHFGAYSRRKHRWVRGDWQIMRWIGSRVPDFCGRLIVNPIPVISRWKMLDNLRRSLLEPSLVLLFLSGWLWLPGGPQYWTGATLFIWFLPVLSGLFFGLARIPEKRRELPAWGRGLARSLWDNAVAATCSLVFLLDQALVSTDAVVRSLMRIFVTKKKLLQWETAAEAENTERPKGAVDLYLEWTPWIAVVLGIAIWLFRPHALAPAAPVLALWFASKRFAQWLSRRSRAGHSELDPEDVQLLRESADGIYRFFHDWSSPATNWLIPDSVRENGAVELRLSPTNLGMLLNARVAGVHLGLTPLAEFVFETRQTLDCVVKLPKYRGHLFNWYDINSLEPVPPMFISSVDSGNLAASLWTLKQAALSFASESMVKRGVTKDLSLELKNIAEICDHLVREMDFRFLYQRRNRTLSIGYDVAAERLHEASYDLLASEARIAAFVAIAKGDIPQEAWFRLGRTHTVSRGERVLISWTGTMFEYLMPLIWTRHYPDTIVDRSARVAVRTQREYGRRKGVPWGISECSFFDASTPDYGYAAFGVPELAMKRQDSNALVISPYSTFLAAGIEPAAAAENLRQMKKFGWFGRYGFYEAIDYSRSGGEAVRIWMAHHQGMSLLSIVNLLFDGCLRNYFHAEPQVMATELLLHERVQPAAAAEEEPVPIPQLEPMAA